MSKRLGGIIGCKYKTSSWHLNDPFEKVLRFEMMSDSSGPHRLEKLESRVDKMMLNMMSQLLEAKSTGGG